MRASRRRPVERRPGYVLIVVLIVIVVLSLSGYRFAEGMTAEFAVAIRSTEAAQAKAFAASGVHYAAAALSDPNTLASLGGSPTDVPSFGNVSVGPSDGPRGGGRFSLFNPDPAGARHGVADESGKLNVNALIRLDSTGQVLHDALMKLPNATEEIADAIVDFLDADDTPRAAGAESEYYSGLSNPYRAKNGPLNTVEELLLVRGVTPQLLFGGDRNRNGRPDPGEDGDGTTRGWAEFLTVYGRELDADATGVPRVALNGDDLTATFEALNDAVGPDLAGYVLLYRAIGQTTSTTATTSSSSSGSGSSGASNAAVAIAAADQVSAAVNQLLAAGGKGKKKLTSVTQLINTRIALPKAADAPRNAPTVYADSPLNDPAKLKELLPKLLDLTTPRTGLEMTPRVNVNTAPAEVLAALPGLTPTEADAILANRAAQPAGDPLTTTGAWLLTSGAVTASQFRSLEKYVTGRSGVYRVQSVGYFGRGGPFARVEAVIDAATPTPRVLYFRDVTDLGRGFELPR